MENFKDSKPDLLSSSGLEVDEQSGNHLKDAGIWARAIAIIVSIICGLATLGLLVFGSAFKTVFAIGFPGYSGVLMVALFIVLGVVLIGVINLFRFSSGITTGINNQDPNAFDKGISGLKNYFILIGVLTLLAIFMAVIQLIN